MLVRSGLAVLCLFAAGCARRWEIKSYDNGVLTASLSGRTYTATCNGHLWFREDGQKMLTQGPQACAYAQEIAGRVFPVNQNAALVLSDSVDGRVLLLDRRLDDTRVERFIFDVTGGR